MPKVASATFQATRKGENSTRNPLQTQSGRPTRVRQAQGEDSREAEETEGEEETTTTASSSMRGKITKSNNQQGEDTEE